jgi:hypothetical protein
MITITPNEYRPRDSDFGNESGILPEMSAGSVRESVFAVRDIGYGAGPNLSAIPNGGDCSLRNVYCTELP